MKPIHVLSLGQYLCGEPYAPGTWCHVVEWKRDATCPGCREKAPALLKHYREMTSEKIDADVRAEEAAERQEREDEAVPEEPGPEADNPSLVGR